MQFGFILQQNILTFFKYNINTVYCIFQSILQKNTVYHFLSLFSQHHHVIIKNNKECEYFDQGILSEKPH